MSPLILAPLLLSTSFPSSGTPVGSEEEPETPFSAKTFAALELRSIGPAFPSGRIADIAVHPERPARWIVATASSGVWRTHNAGTTWESVFDDQGSYSIGCVTLEAERKGGPPPKWIKPLIYLSIPWAVSIHTVTAFLYSGLAARPFWMTAILAPRFLASAFASEIGRAHV